MPELPEVTTFISNLVPNVLNKPIKDIVINDSKVIKNSSEVNFKNFFVGESFIKIQRKGKYIIFYLTNNKGFVLHLRMEGKIIFSYHYDKLINNHNMVTWIFDHNEELRYYDTRMFGTMDIYYGDPFLQSKSLQKLGLEPFDPDFNEEYLKSKFAKHKKSMLKVLLLDQSIIAGIGNIYADEILYACKLNPTALASSLTDNDYKNIVHATKEILLKAIKFKGTTVASYSFDRQEHSGSYQKYLKVHSQKSKKCEICNNLISFTKVNGRGTYYCENCQGKIVSSKLNKDK